MATLNPHQMWEMNNDQMHDVDDKQICERIRGVPEVRNRIEGLVIKMLGLEVLDSFLFSPTTKMFENKLL